MSLGVWLFCLNMWNKINWLRIDNGLTWQGQVRYAIGQNLNKFWFFFANSYVTFELKCTNNVKERIEAKENQSKFCFTDKKLLSSHLFFCINEIKGRTVPLNQLQVGAKDLLNEMPCLRLVHASFIKRVTSIFNLRLKLMFYQIKQVLFFILGVFLNIFITLLHNNLEIRTN